MHTHTHLDLILDCFARRDRPGLEDLLSSEFTYYEVSKANFLDRLEEFWQEWEVTSSLTDPLQVIPGSCCSKACDAHLGKTAYRFRSPDGKYLDLRLVLLPQPPCLEPVCGRQACPDAYREGVVPFFFFPYTFSSTSADAPPPPLQMPATPILPPFL
ncbi:MAG: hypothetical protein ACK5BR_01650 [Bacteroidota bacterium]|jgi:hypothetical protein|nr:hypothetical protein [Algoriphagus sp.]